jgi:hypothetical protein
MVERILIELFERSHFFSKPNKRKKHRETHAKSQLPEASEVEVVFNVILVNFDHKGVQRSENLNETQPTASRRFGRILKKKKKKKKKKSKKKKKIKKKRERSTKCLSCYLPDMMTLC